MALLSDAGATLAVAFIAPITFLLYRAFFHPLSRIPGPLICKFTNIWTWYHTYIGDDCTLINKLHARYGPVLRIGPHECVLADGAALAPVYSERGGFLKSDCYANFNLEGHQTIFSARDPAHRAIRSKAVTALFSTANIRSKHDIFEQCAKRFVNRIKQEAQNNKLVNMLTLCRRAALDLVCSVLFQTPYGGMEEAGDSLSAAVFVDTAVAFGRFFFLPNWLFLAVETTRAQFFPSKEEDVSNSKVDEYGRSLVTSIAEKADSYQARLHRAGVTNHEVEIQCKDVIFAGTDSSGTVLSNICWNLAKHPATYARLKDDVAKADDTGDNYNVQSLKYLDAVVKEGLRLSRANPTRFPRVVPAQGWTFISSSGKEYFFPGGTNVGLAPLTLHFNPIVFPDPAAFRPERWLQDPTLEMQRDLIPFNIGPRQCIARNLAQYELLITVREVARSKVLDGATAVGDEIEVIEWFNSRIVGEKVEISW